MKSHIIVRVTIAYKEADRIDEAVKHGLEETVEILDTTELERLTDDTLERVTLALLGRASAT